MKRITPAILLMMMFIITGCSIANNNEVDEYPSNYVSLDYVISSFTFQLCLDTSALDREEIKTLANEALLVNYSSRQIARTTYLTHRKLNRVTGKYYEIGVCIDTHANSHLLGYVTYKDIAVKVMNHASKHHNSEDYTIHVNGRKIFHTAEETEVVRLLEQSPRAIFKLDDRQRYMNGQ